EGSGRHAKPFYPSGALSVVYCRPAACLVEPSLPRTLMRGGLIKSIVIMTIHYYQNKLAIWPSSAGEIMQDPHCHSSSIAVDRPAEVAFEIMSEGLKQGQWTWGSFNREEVEPGLFRGRSIFTGKDTYVRLNVDRSRFLVDYDVGGTKESMQFRNMSRVIPGD